LQQRLHQDHPGGILHSLQAISYEPGALKSLSAPNTPIVSRCSFDRCGHGNDRAIAFPGDTVQMCSHDALRPRRSMFINSLLRILSFCFRCHGLLSGELESQRREATAFAAPNQRPRRLPFLQFRAHVADQIWQSDWQRNY